jgi:hypothetical protein
VTISPTESLSLAFSKVKIEYFQQDKDGKMATAGQGLWDLTKVSIQVRDGHFHANRQGTVSGRSAGSRHRNAGRRASEQPDRRPAPFVPV